MWKGSWCTIASGPLDHCLPGITWDLVLTWLWSLSHILPSSATDVKQRMQIAWLCVHCLMNVIFYLFQYQSVNSCSVLWVISDIGRVQGEKAQGVLLEESIKACMRGMCTDIALVATKSDILDLRAYNRYDRILFYIPLYKNRKITTYVIPYMNNHTWI